MRSTLVRLIVFALVAAGSVAPVRGADPYEIHAILEQTGQFAFVGSRQAEALHVAEGVVNAEGGIRGRQVRFVVHDDQSSPQVAVQLTNQLAAQKVPVIIGPTLAAVCSAIFPLLEKNGPLEWCMSPVVRPQPGGFSFMYAPGIEDIQPVTIRYFYERGARNFALITTTDTSGQIYDQNFEGSLNRLEFRGAKLIAHERYNLTDISVAAQLARIKAAKPDVIISFSAGPPFGTLLRGIADSGLDVPVYGSGANMSVAQLQQYASFAPKELYFNAAQGFLPDPKAPTQVKRRQAVFFTAMKNAGLHVEYLHTITWDPAMCFVDALRALGTDATAAQLHDYIEHQRAWVGIQGSYNFTTGDQRGLGENGATLVRWNPGKHDFDLVATGPRFL